MEAAVLGGELLCHRFGDDVDVVGRLPVGAYDQPQDRALVPVRGRTASMPKLENGKASMPSLESPPKPLSSSLAL